MRGELLPSVRGKLLMTFLAARSTVSTCIWVVMIWSFVWSAESTVVLGMPSRGISPTMSPLSSVMMRSFLSKVPTYIRPLRLAGVAAHKTRANRPVNAAVNPQIRMMCFIIWLLGSGPISFSPILWVDYVDIPPVVGGRAAFGSPVRVVADMIRNLSGPGATQIAVEQVAFHRRAESRGSAGDIYFPARVKAQRTAERVIDTSMLLGFVLQRLDIARFRDTGFFHLARFPIECV